MSYLASVVVSGATIERVVNLRENQNDVTNTHLYPAKMFISVDLPKRDDIEEIPASPHCKLKAVMHGCQNISHLIMSRGHQKIENSPAPLGPMMPLSSELLNSPLIELRIRFLPSRDDTK